MRRPASFLLVAVAASASLILPAGASSRAGADLTPVEALAPAGGATITAGTEIVFRVRTSPGGMLWLLISKSPTAVDPCGKIGHDAHMDSFKPTAADPSVYESTPPVYTFSGYWSATPGTYYWQAYRIEYGEGADGCIESEVRSLTIEAAAPKPTTTTKSTTPTTTTKSKTPAPKPKQTPKPAPKVKPPRALSAARLQGRFNVIERITAVSNFDEKVGSKDTATWAFVPHCSNGPCRARLAFTVATFGITNARTIRIELTRKGATYSGHGGGRLAECMMTPVSGTIDVSLKVTKGRWVNSVWRAAKWTGTLRLSVPETDVGTARCRAGSFTATVRGSAAS